MIRLGVVADDLTGAGDIAGMTAKAGYATEILMLTHRSTARTKAEVVVIDTDSRLDPADLAYAKVVTATKILLRAGCRQFFNKTCSVFRGNVGAEFDAMLDVLEEDFAVVVLGFPKNGRLTCKGVHYVHGQRLATSPFRHDPVHPMTRSKLGDILRAQTKREVSYLYHDVIAQGPELLKQTVSEARDATNYLILDVVDQEALTVIARAVTDCRILCGSSALAETLPDTWPAPKPATLPKLPPPSALGVLCLAGSLTPQTAAQIEHLEQGGMPSFCLDPRRLFDEQERHAALACLVTGAAARLARGEDVVMYTPNTQSAVQESQQAGAARGLSRAEVGRLVSRSLAEVAAELRSRTGLSRLVIAGGDTSATVCRALGLTRLQVYQELRPGLPSLLSLPDASSEAPLLLVLKSGSFGDKAFLEEAVEHVKAIYEA